MRFSPRLVYLGMSSAGHLSGIGRDIVRPEQSSHYSEKQKKKHDSAGHVHISHQQDAEGPWHRKMVLPFPSFVINEPQRAARVGF